MAGSFIRSKEQRATSKMVMDTSTLLTLLFGTEVVPGDDTLGYLGLITVLGRQDIIQPVITTSVVGELLNSPIPLRAEDLFDLDANGKATAIKYDERHKIRSVVNELETKDYDKWDQRLNFLKELYNTCAEFVETPILEKQYFDTLRSNEDLEKKYQSTVRKNAQLRQQYPATLLECSDETLREFLTSCTSERNAFVKTMVSQRFRQNLGEESIGEYIKTFHNSLENQQETKEFLKEKNPVFVLYEGNDVRARVIYRSNPLNEAVYTLGVQDVKKKQEIPIPAEFNPNRQNFDTHNRDHLAGVSFVSTKGFLNGLIKSAIYHDMFIISRGELDIKATAEYVQNQELNFDLAPHNPVITPDLTPQEIESIKKEVKGYIFEPIEKVLKTAEEALGSHTRYTRKIDGRAEYLEYTPVAKQENVLASQPWKHLLGYETEREPLLRAFAEHSYTMLEHKKLKAEHDSKIAKNAVTEIVDFAVLAFENLTRKIFDTPERYAKHLASEMNTHFDQLDAYHTDKQNQPKPESFITKDLIDTIAGYDRESQDKFIKALKKEIAELGITNRSSGFHSGYRSVNSYLGFIHNEILYNEKLANEQAQKRERPQQRQRG